MGDLGHGVVQWLRTTAGQHLLLWAPRGFGLVLVRGCWGEGMDPCFLLSKPQLTEPQPTIDFPVMPCLVLQM